MKIEKSTEESVLFLRMNNLRGLLAIVVLLSHIWGYTGLVVLVPFNKMVTIAVSIFFFLSGYGMMRSYEKKKQYLKSIFFEKIPFLLYMATMAYMISALFEYIISRVVRVEQRSFLPLGLKNFLGSTNWYVYELIGFYLVFILVMRFVKMQWQIVVMLGITTVSFVMLFHSGLVEAYYNSIFGFYFGMFCYRISFFEWTKKHRYGYMIAGLFLILAFGAMFVLDRNTIFFAVVRNIAAIAAIIMVFYVMPYINIIDKFNKFISKISPEIYFYHMPIALLLSQIIRDAWVYFTIVVALSFIVAIIMNYIDYKVQTIMKRGALR